MDKVNKIPTVGQMVIVRGRPAIVKDITPSKNSTNIELFHAVDVQYIDGWMHPEKDIVIWEIENEAKTVPGNMMPKIDNENFSPDEPEKLKAFINSYKWSSVARINSTSENVNLTAPWQSSVQIEDYQLYPVLKSLAMPRVSLLLADDVGLGKTIEAGLIVSELIARNRVKRVLVICPASLQLQWKEELKEKFHLDFEVIDRKKTFDIQRTMGINSNPWAIYPRIIASMDYLRQPDVQQAFKAATQSMAANIDGKLPWQMLIVDEAHNFAPSGMGTNTQRYEMLRELSLNFEHKLFLTATPHNGYTHSFTGLLELLDPVRFDQKTELEEKDHDHIETVMVRRLKRDLNTSRNKRFVNRYVDSIEINLNKEEKELFEALREYRSAGKKLLAKKEKRERHIGEFLFKLLTKRLLSGSYAFACTWWQHVEGMDETELSSFNELEYAKDRVDNAIDDDIEKEQREEEAVRKTGAWLTQYKEELKDEIKLVSSVLTSMGLGKENIRKDISTWSKFQNESKWDNLITWIINNLKDGKNFKSDERVIIFTEYKQTLAYLIERFRKSGIQEPVIDMLYGGMSSEKRQEIKERFNDPTTPLKILLATDAASEGVNLQTGCRYIFHYDVPWNPMRMEQRNGRVDRHGQYRDVYIHHFNSKDDEDMQFLSRILQKVDQVREDLGSVGQVLDRMIEKHFDEVEVNINENLDVEFVGQSYKSDMKQRITDIQKDSSKALQRLTATEISLDLNPDNVASIFKYALQSDGGDLEEIQTQNGNIYRINPIPPTWNAIIDETIRIKNGKQKGALPRVVFDSSYFEKDVNGYKVYSYSDEIVLLRLGHPLIQKAVLNMKRELWEAKKLSRWTIQKGNLPHGINELIQIDLLLEVTNKLREVIHQEVITLSYQCDGENIIAVDDSLKQYITNIQKQKLTVDELDDVLDDTRDEWYEIESDIRKEIQRFKDEKERWFKQTLEDKLKEDKEIQKQIFDSRINELKDDKLEKVRQKIANDLIEQTRDLQELQMSLIEDAEGKVKEQIKNLEVQRDLIISNKQIMKDILERERERVLTKVLPKRYNLNNIEVHPLAIEYIVKG
ncbi:SNF2-like protein [[Clostridium] sordellii]|uniref:DISARM system SNF2-like helicase DrmD n=1 Tax=Paraclostridium sordellii TaxID=1505 RepID=UPI0005DE9582|nr:DISARM system SNF2-like helicase DrmD [Paeniclostridium sordellii]CEN89110.1 SNF2-like protein [[Clostridium] sordellii] [Paeniclostridium sordellii]